MPASFQQLDLRGLTCPLPVLRTRKALRRMRQGDGLVVVCSDPLAVIDIPHMVREGGHVLLQSTVSDGISTFHIVKRREGPSTSVP